MLWRTRENAVPPPSLLQGDFPLGVLQRRGIVTPLAPQNWAWWGDRIWLVRGNAPFEVYQTAVASERVFALQVFFNNVADPACG